MLPATLETGKFGWTEAKDSLDSGHLPFISFAMFLYPVAHTHSVSLPKEWDSEWLHSVVLGWRKWFEDQSRAKLQAEKMASQAKGLLCRL